MSLRVACDLDGTVADMEAALQREATRLFGPDVDLHASAPRPLESAEDVEGQVAEPVAAGRHEVAQPPTSRPRGRPLTRSQIRTLWAHVTDIEDFWRSLGEIEPGAVARLGALVAQHRWEVIFLTKRPTSAGDTVQVQSQRWLHAHGFELPSVFVMQGSRGHVAEALALDAVIDDRPENCMDVVTDSSATPFLIWRHHPDTVPPTLRLTRTQVVHSIGEALDRLEALAGERVRTGRKSLLGRVKAAMGLEKR